MEHIATFLLIVEQISGNIEQDIPMLSVTD